VQITVELCLLLSCQDSSLRSIRKLKHSLLIAIIESNREQEFGDIGRQFVFLCSYQPRPNGRFTVRAKELGTHRELVSIVAPAHAS